MNKSYLRSYLEEVADNDLAPTVGRMRRSRVGTPHVKSIKRQPKAAVSLSPRFERAMHTGGFTK